ncbi:MAG: hypothetical protein JNG84_10630 [Archangium sp.]|nr:hypothetical protein [Archangium sp.]
MSHLETTGELPAGFESRRAEAMAKLAEDPEYDPLYEVPLDLAEEETNFRHDSCERDFEVLELINPPAPPKKPWWKRW